METDKLDFHLDGFLIFASNVYESNLNCCRVRNEQLEMSKTIFLMTTTLDFSFASPMNKLMRILLPPTWPRALAARRGWQTQEHVLVATTSRREFEDETKRSENLFFTFPFPMVGDKLPKRLDG